MYEHRIIKEWKDRPWHVGMLDGHVYVSNGWTMDYPLYQRHKGCVAYDNPESKPKYLTDWVRNAYHKGVLK